MVYLEGMIPNKGYSCGASTGMESIRISDMVPNEEFECGCIVCLPGKEGFEDGVLVEIDPDNRLGKVYWQGGAWGWWYLKDLKIVGYQVDQGSLKNKRVFQLTKGAGHGA